LIAARAVQGAGAAILAPSTLALLQTCFEEGPERTRAVSYYAAVAGVASTVGLVVGGIFAGLLSWRVGFFINLPIGAAMIFAAPRYLPETEPRRGQTDAAGALASTLGMTALVFGVVHSAEAGWGDPVTAVALATGVLLLTAFVMNEAARRSRSCRSASSPAASAPAPTPLACCSSVRWRRSGSSRRNGCRACTVTPRCRPGWRSCP
jgi:MFS family permease